MALRNRELHARNDDDDERTCLWLVTCVVRKKFGAGGGVAANAYLSLVRSTSVQRRINEHHVHGRAPSINC